MKIVLLATFCVLIANFSYAQVIFEPTAAYQFSGTSEIGGDYSATGYGAGAKLGYQSLGFVGGMELMANTFRINKKSTRINEAGAYIGYNLPMGLRFWTSIIFLGSYQQSKDPNKYDGSGYKIGMGYSPIPLLSLNLEYRYLDFFRKNEKEIEPSYKLRGILFSVSAPLPF